MRKIVLLSVAATLFGILFSGCGGPKVSKEEETAPPSRGPQAGGGAPNTAAAPSSPSRGPGTGAPNTGGAPPPR